MFLTKYLIVILVLIYCSTNFVNGDNFLILHPFYSGSHVLTLHHVAESLVSRGHKVIFFFKTHRSLPIWFYVKTLFSQ